LNWTNRFTAPIGSKFPAAALVLAAALAIPALANTSLTAIYQQQSIRFTHLESYGNDTAIGVDDPGFATLLRECGAVLTWKPGERYVLITTDVPVVVSFAIGDRRYDVGPISLQANFAPYQRGDEAYLPFNEVLHALDLALRQDGGVAVLQPQLASLDVRNEGDRVALLAHGGAPLRPRIVQQSSAAVTYEFDGVGTTLAGTRPIGAGGVRSVTIVQSGTVRDPKALVTVQLMPGAAPAAPQQTDDRDVLLGFSGSGGGPAAPVVAEQSPTPMPPPQGAAVASAPQAATVAPQGNPNAATTVTGVTVQRVTGGVTVTIAITGNATFEWHRLREPDNRFWVDIQGAQLQGPPIEQNEPSPLLSMRVRQDDPTTVRVALSLSGPKSIEVSPSNNALDVEVGDNDVADATRAGSGSVGSVVAVSEPNATFVTPAPSDQYAEPQNSQDTTWKFGPRGQNAPQYVPTNPRLIVIDPGHGGSDRGTMHGGLEEAVLTLDMAKRLRDILVTRGWEVKLTHDTDTDVYAPNADAHQELQARADVANNAGARLFVSVHVNAYINSGPSGTTCYISKPDDVAFARIVETHLAADGTKDDGVIKSRMYVTLHTRMPAVLVETAFLTNPGDYALLASAAWRQKVAQELADAIGQYTQEYPVPNQPAQ
jgi:N-acetylmuramoyl-L-alanine amidase